MNKVLLAFLVWVPACVHASAPITAPPIFIQQCPAPPVVWQPDLRIGGITATTSAFNVMKWYILDLWDVMGYATELEMILDSYRSEVSDASR